MAARNDGNRGRGRPEGPRPFVLPAGKEYEIKVEAVLNGKWALTVYKLPERTIVTEDFFGERGLAVGRAYDFRSIIVSKDQPVPARESI